jgi:hypothetical protein
MPGPQSCSTHACPTTNRPPVHKCKARTHVDWTARSVYLPALPGAAGSECDLDIRVGRAPQTNKVDYQEYVQVGNATLRRSQNQYQYRCYEQKQAKSSPVSGSNGTVTPVFFCC